MYRPKSERPNEGQVALVRVTARYGGKRPDINTIMLGIFLENEWRNFYYPFNEFTKGFENMVNEWLPLDQNGIPEDIINIKNVLVKADKLLHLVDHNEINQSNLDKIFYIHEQTRKIKNKL